MLKSCWETEILNEIHVYKRELGVLNVSKSVIFIRPQHLDDIKSITSKSIFGESGKPPAETDYNMIDHYTPDKGIPLALQEFDELSSVGFSFRTKSEAKRFLENEDCIKILEVVSYAQKNHVNLLKNAVSIRVNCQTWDTYSAFICIVPPKMPSVRTFRFRLFFDLFFLT